MSRRTLTTIISVFFTLISIFSYSQKKHLFDSSDGLSNSLINQVYQDSDGFIWAVTGDGINRFDGVKFKSVLFADTDGMKKIGSTISIIEDKHHNIWIGSIEGFFKYDKLKETVCEIPVFASEEKIRPYIADLFESKDGDVWLATSGFGILKVDTISGTAQYLPRLNENLCSIYMQCICEDSRGLLWFGSYDSGLNVYNRQTGEINHYSISSPIEKYKLNTNDISALCEDSHGNILVGSANDGLLIIKINDGTVEQINSANKYETNLSVRCILKDSNNNIWVGTDGLGLKILNKTTNQLESFSPQYSPFDFTKSKIHTIEEDDSGNIWLGVYQKGLVLLNRATEMFINYGYMNYGHNSIGSNCITSITGSDEELWIGTDGDGIYHLNRSTNNAKHIPLKQKELQIVGNNVLCLYNDTNDYLYAGTFSNGIVRYNKKTEEMKFYKNNPNDLKSLANDKTTTITKGKDNLLYIGTLGGGICRFDPITEAFTSGLNISDYQNKMINKWINCIYIDKYNNFWIGTYDGVFLVNPKTKKINMLNVSNGFIPGKVAYTIKSDSKENIWIGTNNGLVSMNSELMDVRFYTTTHGLCSNSICDILEDKYGQIWVSTHNGLSRLDPQTEVFVNYYASDGIQANEFARNATFKTASGVLFFGGINGITELRKDYRSFSEKISEVILTDFFLFDKSVKINQKTNNYTILNKSIVWADTVQLTESDNVFSIDFTSKEIANPNRIKYQYKLDGFDLNWNTAPPTKQQATYTNLKHGKYKFKVRGAIGTQYSPARKLTILIFPPWYKTVWAKTIWSFLAVCFMLSIYIFINEKNKRKSAEKLNEVKMQFFMNISHEIKTPLTLILDPIDKLLNKKNDADTTRLYSTIKQNATRISKLITQMLDVRRIDKGLMVLKFQKTNMNNFISDLAHSFDVLAENKNITYKVVVPTDELCAWIDPMNFEKIVFNLLSNAFKFTPSGGEIEIAMFAIKKTNDECLQIIVKDTGVGLKKDDEERIFERFYQVDSNETVFNTGTGIGLHLSRALVNLHKGSITAQNRSDTTGACFFVSIPQGCNHLDKKDLVNCENRSVQPETKISSDIKEQKNNTYKKTNKPATNYKIMIIDDDDNIRNYLVQELSPIYNIFEFINGKQAFENLIATNPDLIISDIMMPEMNGIAFCKKVKSNFKTGHIPVILLTALSKDEQKTEGLEVGADMYLVKPFGSDFLKTTIAGILENRRKIYEKTDNNTERAIGHIEIKSHDDVLLQKITTIIRENITNPDLNVEMLAQGVGISRVHMHRKLKAITSLSARDFIKDARMKQASYLLTNKQINISEVAYAVGYTNLSHFSNTFKAYYGVSPTDFAQQQQKNN